MTVDEGLVVLVVNGLDFSFLVFVLVLVSRKVGNLPFSFCYISPDSPAVLDCAGIPLVLRPGILGDYSVNYPREIQVRGWCGVSSRAARIIFLRSRSSVFEVGVTREISGGCLCERLIELVRDYFPSKSIEFMRLGTFNRERA